MKQVCAKRGGQRNEKSSLALESVSIESIGVPACLACSSLCCEHAWQGIYQDASAVQPLYSHSFCPSLGAMSFSQRQSPCCTEFLHALSLSTFHNTHYELPWIVNVKNPSTSGARREEAYDRETR